MVILLTNDDGIYAPGLAALHRQLASLGDVYIVAPATEQSGVGHAITYLTPLVVKEVFQNERMVGGSNERWGWAVQGSPADCVKIGVGQFCPQRPDLVVSGINAGLNAGINVLYSGTVAAAIEGAFYGITSIACSLQYEPHFQFDRAAELACDVIEQILGHKVPKESGPKESGTQLYNINIPTAALSGTPKVCVAPMHVARVNDRFEKRSDPFGRTYYWLIGERSPVSPGHVTDMSAIAQGMISLTPLHFDLTSTQALTEMQGWPLTVRPPGSRQMTQRQQFQQQQGGHL
jgi:5'-nucleotidase